MIRASHQMSMSPRMTDSLDSKLSPRAFPSHAPRPARVATGERSAFQRVTLEATPMDFYSLNRNNNNNYSDNNGTDKDGNGDRNVRQTARSSKRMRDSNKENDPQSYLEPGVHNR